MRKMLVIVLFIMLNLVQHRLMAQDYIPFPDSGAVWINYDYVQELDPFYHLVFVGADNYCVNGEDTVINSINYTKLNYCEGAYKAAIRSDNGKVYFVPPDSVSELLLYDFTVEQGDTLENYYAFRGEPSYPWLLPPTRIGPVDSVNINGVYHKRIEMDMGYWIEGIGCTNGLFYEPLPNVSFAAYELHCMSYNDTTLYPQLAYTNCLNPISIEGALTTINKTLNIYPNPATTTLTVQSMVNSPWSVVSIYTAQGALVYHSTFDIERSTFDISPFANGLYYLHLQSAEGIAIKKFQVIR